MGFFFSQVKNFDQVGEKEREKEKNQNWRPRAF